MTAVNPIQASTARCSDRAAPILQIEAFFDFFCP
jgi:hypothetical protein